MSHICLNLLRHSCPINDSQMKFSSFAAVRADGTYAPVCLASPAKNIFGEVYTVVQVVCRFFSARVFCVFSFSLESNLLLETFSRIFCKLLSCCNKRGRKLSLDIRGNFVYSLDACVSRRNTRCYSEVTIVTVDRLSHSTGAATSQSQQRVLQEASQREVLEDQPCKPRTLYVSLMCLKSYEQQVATLSLHYILNLSTL